MIPYYSLRQVVRDGRLVAPRYAQHLFKIGVHMTVALLLALLFMLVRGWGAGYVASAVLGGPVLWLLIASKESTWPSDPQIYSVWQHAADWLTDCALSCVPLVVALLVVGDWVSGAVLAVACVAAYTFCHRNARP